MSSNLPRYGQPITRVDLDELLAAIGGSIVTSVTGTANQVTVAPNVGAVVVSLPTSGTLPGTWHAATGFVVDAGNLTLTAGRIEADGNYTASPIINTPSGDQYILGYDGTAKVRWGSSGSELNFAGVSLVVPQTSGYRFVDGQRIVSRTSVGGGFVFTPLNGSVSSESNYNDFGAPTVTITGTFSPYRWNVFSAPIITAGSVQTIAIAATVAIPGAPSAAGSAVITNPLAFWVQSGNSRFDGGVIVPTSSSTTVPSIYPVGGASLGINMEIATNTVRFIADSATRASFSNGIWTFATIPVVFAAATASIPSVRLPHGTAPSSPTDGDMWTTTAGLFVRINGATVGPLS